MRKVEILIAQNGNNTLQKYTQRGRRSIALQFSLDCEVEFGRVCIMFRCCSVRGVFEMEWRKRGLEKEGE